MLKLTLSVTGMDWILPGCTPVRSGHQSTLARALYNKRGGERYWLVRVNISKSLSFSFLMHLFTCLSFSLLFFPTWSLICLSFPLPISLTSSTPSNNLFITDLFIMYSRSLGLTNAATMGCQFTLAGCNHHSFTPFFEPSSSSSSLQNYLGAGRVTLVQSYTILIPLDN